MIAWFVDWLWEQSRRIFQKLKNKEFYKQIVMVILPELRRPEFILIHESLERSNNSPVNMSHHVKENVLILAVL